MRVQLRSAAEGEGFVPPSSNDFELPPIFGDNPYTTKPIFLVLFSVILISTFFILSSRKASIQTLRFGVRHNDNDTNSYSLARCSCCTFDTCW